MPYDPRPVYEAATPGSSLPSAGILNARGSGGGKGFILPPISLPTNVPASFQRVAYGFANTIQIGPPSGAVGRASDYPAVIAKSLPPIGESLSGKVYGFTPIPNVTGVISDLPNVHRLPAIPPGLRERTAELMPPGIRVRMVAITRAWARVRSKRPTTGGRIGRE